MKIEIWSDFVCPFCYIGKRQLEKAIEKFQYKDEVTIQFRSYELRPNIPVDTGKSMAEMLMEKFDITVEEAETRLASIAERGKSANLQFNFDTMIPTNTFNAHRLIKYAETEGKAEQLMEIILSSYFTSSKHIGDLATLTKLGVTAGLAEDEVAKVLNDESLFAKEVKADQNKAREIGVRGVPFFLINGEHSIAGSQTPEKFLEYLQQFWSESENGDTEGTQFNSTDGEGCIDDNCAIPPKK